MNPSNVSSASGRRCRQCGCTDEHACAGGCAWVDVDLCSACTEPLIWPCLWAPCAFTSTDYELMRVHEHAEHPELMEVLRELLEEHARKDGLIR